MNDSFAVFYQHPYLHSTGQSYQTRWINEPKLQRNINNLYQQQNNLTVNHCLRQFLTHCFPDHQTNFLADTLQPQQTTLAKDHLFAFLSRDSLKVAQKIRGELSKSANAPKDTYDFFQDLLQITLITISNPLEFYHPFQDRTGTSSINIDWQTQDLTYLKGWTYQKIYGRTVDYIRENISETFKRTDIGVAKRYTQTKVIKALTFTGNLKVEQSPTPQPLIDYKILLTTPQKEIQNALSCCGNWQFAKHAFTLWQIWQNNRNQVKVTDNKLSEAAIRQLKTIYQQQEKLDLDNQRIRQYLEHLNQAYSYYSKIILLWKVFKKIANLRKDLTPQLDSIVQYYQQLSPLPIPLTTDQIIPIIESIGQALRRYIERPIDSLDKPIGEQGTSTLLDTLEDTTQPSDNDLDNPVTDTESSLKFEQIVTSLIHNLSSEQQLILVKLYDEKLNQTQIAQQIGCSQPTIQRRIKAILTTLLEGIKQEFTHSPTPSLKSLELDQKSLKSWLKANAKTIFPNA